MFLFYFFIAVSLIFFALSILGLFRLPDVYTRLHCSSLALTFGFVFFVLSVVTYFSAAVESNFSAIVRVFLVALIVLLVGPVLSHAIAKASYESGAKPQKAEKGKFNQF
jgi:multicomponent Na+:H+ antiporter subunit G